MFETYLHQFWKGHFSSFNFLNITPSGEEFLFEWISLDFQLNHAWNAPEIDQRSTHNVAIFI